MKLKYGQWCCEELATEDAASTEAQGLEAVWSVFLLEKKKRPLDLRSVATDASARELTTYLLEVFETFQEKPISKNRGHWQIERNSVNIVKKKEWSKKNISVTLWVIFHSHICTWQTHSPHSCSVWTLLSSLTVPASVFTPVTSLTTCSPRLPGGYTGLLTG